MGDKRVTMQTDEEQMRQFTRAVLNDLQALEKMFADGLMESGTMRIGAEQEMFLVDSSFHPAPLALQIIEAARDKRLTTEIGQFNLEANLTPLPFSGDCLGKLETELNEIIGIVRKAAKKFDAETVLCGILPTIQLSDLTEKNLTPNPRYLEMNRVLTALHGEERIVHIKGLDEIKLHLQDTFSEFCNTSFQIHLQVPNDDFARYYNWAQAITPPVLASAVNSPILLSHRLWHETRLALFQHSTDERSMIQQERSRPARVTFGRDWVKDSILEIFREDVARFRIILTRELEENSLAALRQGKIPALHAWRMHNSTIWRWNRACYGRMNGIPSLRIEARFLPAGPTVADEMANSAFFLGLMMALPEEFGDVTKSKLTFDDAKINFFSTARYGLKSQIAWIDGKSYPAQKLILEELLPRARRGLESVNIDSADIEKFLGILEERVSQGKTGAQWMLDSLAAMDKPAKANVRLRTLTAAMVRHQKKGEPLHLWKLAEIEKKTDWIDNYKTVEQFMSRDLFTVRPEDVIDLAANLMNWRHIRHVPVEDGDGNLVGIVSHRDLVKLFAENFNKEFEITVKDVMKTGLITISPETRTLDALYLMREKKIGCLPIVKGKKLVGLITDYDFLTVSTRLLEERIKQKFH